MRENMPAIIIFLVFAFILTIIFEWGMDYLGISSQQQEYVGVINDRNITYQEFVELVRERSEQQKTQTGKEPDENELNRIRDEVWNSLVTQTLIDEEIQRLGIEVPDQEIVDWVKGENPPEFLHRQFVDSVGNFNRAAYESAISDPRNKEIWIRVEEGLKKQRMQEKLQSIILAGVRVSESEIFQKFAEQNLKLGAEYIFFDPNKLVTDEEAKVTDSEIEKFYNQNSTEYKVEATRKLEYVKFIEAPSSKDTLSVVAELDDVLRRISSGADFMDMFSTYAENQTTDIFYKPGDLTPVKADKIFSAKVGEVVGPFADNDGYHLVKILEEKTGTEDFVKASHILFSTQGADSVKVLTEAKDVLNKIRAGEDFAKLAEKYSQDPGSAIKGGDLGWFGKGRMVKQFEDACYKTAVNQITGPIRTQFGYHIIKVTGKSKRELKIADIAIPVRVSSETRSVIYQNAQDFKFLAEENDFIKEAEVLKYEVLETASFGEKGIIPGIGHNPSINRFAFEKKLGTISDVLPLTEGYGVFIISEVKKEGIRPLADLKESIRPRVLRDKKMQLLKNKVSDYRKQIQSSDPLSVLTQKNADLSVQVTGQFTLAGGVPGIGRDMMFIGSLLSLKQNEISKPIEGLRGFYIAKLTERVEVDSVAYKAQKDMLASQTLQTKKSQFLSEWLEQLRKNAEIKDNRDLYFR